MKVLNLYSIREKIWLGAFFIILLFIIEGGVIFLLSRQTQRYLDPVRVQQLSLAVRVEKYLEGLKDLLSEYATTGESVQFKEAEEIKAKALSLLSEMQRYFPENRQFYREVKILFEQYLDQGKIFADTLFSSSPFDSQLAESVEKTYNRLHNDIEKYIIRERNHLLTIFHEANENFSRNHKFILFLTLLITLLSVMLIRLFIRSLIRPISVLDQATKSLGKGNLDIEVRIDSKDEFQSLGDSFNYMVKSLRDKTTRLEEARDHLSNLLKKEIKMEEELRSTNAAYKKVCEDLTRANRSQSEFLTNMSHELRTPLNAIINFTDQVVEDWEELASDPEWKKEAREMLKMVIHSSKNLLSLINDLLDIVKIESGKMSLNITSCDLIMLLENTLAEISSLTQAKGIVLKKEIPASLPEFYCDERMLRQVIINLLSNAIKFTPQGSVTLRVLPRDQQSYFIKVIDTGIGIPEKELSLIFDRFYQVQSLDSRNYQGTGLGLSLAREVIRLHGGAITAASKPGAGSTFTIILPVVAKGYDRLKEEIGYGKD